MPAQQQQLQDFFDTMLLDMAEHSPAIADLHPLLKNAFFATLKNGTLDAKKAILKTLLSETHEYVAVAQQLQKKYGIDPEAYIQKLEGFLTQSLTQENVDQDQDHAQNLLNTL
ncbi:MAG: hypothetical protein AAB551_03055 [Patescibacteria group bacterium]|mgnify:CR=1 FL=1